MQAANPRKSSRKTDIIVKRKYHFTFVVAASLPQDLQVLRLLLQRLFLSFHQLLHPFLEQFFVQEVLVWVPK